MAPATDKRAFMILIGATMITIFSIVYLLQFCRTRIGKSRTEPKDDQATDPLSPSTLSKSQRVSKIASVADAVRMSTLNSRNSMNSYDRNHITGASSSTTNGSSMVAYPINPPPSPATRSRRPYRHYKIQPEEQLWKVAAEHHRLPEYSAARVWQEYSRCGL